METFVHFLTCIVCYSIKMSLCRAIFRCMATTAGSNRPFGWGIGAITTLLS